MPSPTGLLELVGAELIVSSIPAESRSILDLSGTGGELARAIRSTRDCRITTVEADREHYEKALPHADETVLGNPERSALAFLPESFDAILAIGTLERAVDPWSFAGYLTRLLLPGGMLAAACANPLNIGFIADGIDGKWHYGPGGELDGGTFHLITPRTLVSILQGAGLMTPNPTLIPGRRVQLAPQAERGSVDQVDTSPGLGSRRVSFGKVTLNGLDEEDILVVNASSALVTGSKPVAPAGTDRIHRPPDVSVITVVHNGAADIARLLGVVAANMSSGRSEMIVVDNGSTDELTSLKSKIEAGFLVEHLADPVDLIEAASTGASQARGRYLLFMDQQSILGPDDLEQVVSLFESDRNVGAAQIKVQLAGDPIRSSFLHPLAVRRTAFEMVGGFGVASSKEPPTDELLQKLTGRNWLVAGL